MTITRPNGTRLRFHCEDADGDSATSAAAELTVIATQQHRVFNELAPENWPQPVLPPLTAPDLSTTTATTINSGVSLAAAADAAPAGASFLVRSGADVNNVRPKQGQRFIGEPGCVINGGGATWAFHGRTGGAPDALVANMVLQGFGASGSLNQDVGVLDCKQTNGNHHGTDGKSVNWRVHQVHIRNSNNPGIWFGDHWTVDYCTFEDLNPQAIGGSGGVGGRISWNDFQRCGQSGASGSGVNNGAIKIVLWNVGPHNSGEGTETHRYVWIGGNGALVPFEDQVTNAPARIIVDNNLFNDCDRSVWFDIDVRDYQVACNLIEDSVIAGIFAEGCNVGHIHHNYLNNCGTFTPSTSRYGNDYYGHGAIVTDSSDNDITEYNRVNDSPSSIIHFLGERGRNGADWVTPGTDYALKGYITNSFVPRTPGQRSSVGSSNHTVRNNALRGTSVGMGYMLNGGINSATEANLATNSWTGNVYDVTSGQAWWDNGQRYTYAGWQAAGNQ